RSLKWPPVSGLALSAVPPRRVPLGPPPLSVFRREAGAAELHTLSLRDALPICPAMVLASLPQPASATPAASRTATARVRLMPPRSEEHTSELQSRENLVCRLLLEKKNQQQSTHRCLIQMDEAAASGATVHKPYA